MTREEILKTAKPILFNTDMVRAILDGRKTVTRRVVKPQPDSDIKYKLGYCVDGDKRDIGKFGFCSHEYGGHIVYAKPPYQIGDCLFVRETFFEHKGKFYYRADRNRLALIDLIGGREFLKWIPSIHMPKETARIFLRVVDVRVERLRDITDSDCEKEGIRAWSKDGKLWKYAPADEDGDYPIWTWKDTPRTPQEAMKRVWDSVIPKKDLDKYGWNANPWVWVIQFERVEV